MRPLFKFLARPKQLVQLCFFVITVLIGFQFYLYVHQSMSGGPVRIMRPAGVEGFLPIGALMGWKRFFLTGAWDPIHPAAMVILGFAVLLSFLLRKTFCGWFCPVGTLSEWCWRLGRRFWGRNFGLPLFLDFPLRGLKYFLLLFFVWAIYQMDAGQIQAFMHSPYYKVADTKMLFFFTRMTALSASILAGLVLFSLFIKNFWCRYLCPYGALVGIVALFSPTRIRRHESQCNNCGRCTKACPADLPVATRPAIYSPECTGCLDCVADCSEPGALTFSTKGLPDRFWSIGKVGICIVVSFYLTVYAATITGHWRGAVSDREYSQRLQILDAPQSRHPSFR